jgi:hypothetical protein
MLISRSLLIVNEGTLRAKRGLTAFEPIPCKTQKRV